MLLNEKNTLYNGGYSIIKSIGRGGFGVTYLAEQSVTKRKVCIKEFFPKNYYKRESDSAVITLVSEGFEELMTRFKSKFLKEAQTIAELDHPNIVSVYDAFEENGTAYYVMEYLEGESLHEMVKRRGSLSEAEAVEYIIAIANALDYLHQRRIMHLDVKPANIVVRNKDKRPILIDFGLSKHYDQYSGDATSTTLVGVSHGYAPIEQYQQGGVSTFSPETDIYSLGATLYYLVTGITPPQALVVADDGLPSLPKHISNNIVSAINQSMVDKRKDRLHSIKAFLDVLGNCRPNEEVENIIKHQNGRQIVVDCKIPSNDKTLMMVDSEESSVSVKQSTDDNQSSSKRLKLPKSTNGASKRVKEESERRTNTMFSRIISDMFAYQPTICLHLGTGIVAAWALVLCFDWGWFFASLGGFFVMIYMGFTCPSYRFLLNWACWIFIIIDIVFLNGVCLDELLFPILSLIV